jgi:thymidine phosphorylase
MRDLGTAKELGRSLHETALAFQRRCTVLFTAMDAPLGRTVGNAPEVIESLDLLAGSGPSSIRDLALALVAEMSLMAGIHSDRTTAWAEGARKLDDGGALEIFLSMAAAQGGELDAAKPAWGLPRAPERATVRASRDGFLPAPDARTVGRTAVALGAGRLLAGSAVDPRAGITFLRDWGAPVSVGDELCLVEGSDGARVQEAARALTELLAPASEPPDPDGTLFHGILDDSGFQPYDKPDC